MFNKVILIGRLTRDPELRYTPGGKAVASFRLAVDRGTTNAQGEKETDFIDIVVWERQAESAAKYLTKGRLCLVDGRLQMRQYEAQDGTRRTAYEVVGSWRFLPEGRGQGPEGGLPGGEAGGERESSAPPARRGPRQEQPAGTFGQEFNPDEEDDVPF